MAQFASTGNAGCLKNTLQWYSKCYCLASVTKTFTLLLAHIEALDTSYMPSYVLDTAQPTCFTGVTTKLIY
jgi:hypothetical protein